MSKKNSVVLVDLGTGGQKNLLPLSVGYVLSYSANQPDLKEICDFRIHFLKRDPSKLYNGKAPDVVGIACHVWNERASFAFAKGVRERFPNALIILGGYSIPSFPERIKPFMKKHPYVDVLVHGEGEIPFAEVLRAKFNNTDMAPERVNDFETLKCI